MMILGFIFGSLFSIFNHDVPIAKFLIFENAERQLGFEFVLHDESIQREVDLNLASINQVQLEAYFRDQLNITFDETSAEIDVLKVQKEEHHLRIEGLLRNANKEWSSIVIKNRCLLSVPNQANIVQLQLRNVERDFHMHKGRQEIRVEY